MEIALYVAFPFSTDTAAHGGVISYVVAASALTYLLQNAENAEAGARLLREAQVRAETIGPLLADTVSSAGFAAWKGETEDTRVRT